MIDRALAFQKADRWPDAVAMRDAVRDASLAIFGRTPGTTSDLVGTFTGQNSSGCSFLANVVSATTATAPAGQTCTESSGTDTALLTLGAYHFIITGSTTADEVTSATITDETTSVTCNLSSRANYTKM